MANRLVNWLKAHRRLALAATLAAAAILLAAGIYYSKFYSRPYPTKYSQELSAQKANGINLSKPSQFSNVTLDKTSAEFTSVFVDKRSSDNIGLLITNSSQPVPPDSLKDVIKPINDALAKPDSPAYEQLKTNIAANLSGQLGKELFKVDDKKVKVELGGPKTVELPQVPSNAWQFDFKATNEAAGILSRGNKAAGRLVYFNGLKDVPFYSVTLVTTDYNWQPNEQVWQQIIDSIKVDR